MSRKDKNKATVLEKKKRSADKRLQWIYLVIIIALTVGINFNTIWNSYSLDDYHIAKNNADFEQGISSIPRILSSLYAVENGLSYGYRPLARISFAIEYQLFGKQPGLSHFFNILFYLIAILLFYRVVRRLLKDYHPLLPFIITLLFLVHPVRTEIVASLKNRDEIFALIFSFWSLDQFITYAERSRLRNLVYGILLFILSFFAKPTATAFFLVIPLALYFFTGMDVKGVIRVFLILLAAGLVANLSPYLWLPERERPLAFFENPLVADPSLANRIAYGGFTLYYYLRLLFFPHPLRYYYGYDVFPDINFSNWIVIVSIIFHVALLVYAIWKLKDKHILSFAILAYLVSIAMFTNVVKPAPGIIAERFLNFPLIGFSFAIGYLLFRIFRIDPAMKTLPTGRTVGMMALLLILMVPLTAKTYIRNFDWRSQYSLYAADMPFLYNSVKGNELYANEIMKYVNVELSKPVNVTKFIEPMIQDALTHFERSVEIDSSFSSSYRNMGIIYSRIYKEYDTAIAFYNKALRYNPDNPQTLFQLGMAYEGKQEYATAIDYYKKSLSLDSNAINTRSRLANVYYGLGEFREAILLNQEIMKIDPGESLPYVNLGNYYMFQRDTTNAISLYEKAVELGAPAPASRFLSKYFESKGDIRKSNYYKKIADDLDRQPYQP